MGASSLALIIISDVFIGPVLILLQCIKVKYMYMFMYIFFGVEAKE